MLDSCLIGSKAVWLVALSGWVDRWMEYWNNLMQATSAVTDGGGGCYCLEQQLYTFVRIMIDALVFMHFHVFSCIFMHFHACMQTCILVTNRIKQKPASSKHRQLQIEKARLSPCFLRVLQTS
jgi:regulator of sigma D